jgi:hypothetical protein
MLFNQQQCFIYSTASFLSKLRAKKVEKTASTNEGLPEIQKMKYRNRIPEPGTTISGFAESKKTKTNLFFLHVTVNTHIYIFLALL